MEPPKQYAELSDVRGLLQRYKDFRGDRFDGTLYQKDVVPGIGSVKFIYRWLHKIIDGECDMEDGITEVKAKARKTGYLITMEDFLDMLQMYVEAEGRIGRFRKGVVIDGINVGKMYWFVTKARLGKVLKLILRNGSIHPGIPSQQSRGLGLPRAPGQTSFHRE